MPVDPDLLGDTALMPWRVRRQLDKRPIVIAIVAGVLVIGSIAVLWFAYRLPPCSLEAETLLRQLNLCR